MKALFGTTRHKSDKNGEIIVSRMFGRPDTYVGGTDQSTPYMRRLWKESVRHVAKSKRKILMLGLGTGIGLQEIRRRFPEAELTVVEWDPVMIGLFHEFRPDEQVEILQGDVRDVLPGLQRKFDLILVDIFQGHDPAPALYEERTIRGIAGVLAEEGECILNAYEAQDLILRFSEFLMRTEAWVHRVSHLAKFARTRS